MRLLFLAPQLPYPPHQGTTIRNFNILKGLAPRHSITLITFGTPDELHAAAALRDLCEHIEIAPYPSRSLAQRAVTTLASPLPDMALRLRSATLQAQVASLLAHTRFDLCQIEGIEMARFWMAELDHAPARLPPFVFDDHNAEYVLQKTAFESDLHHPERWHAALYSWIQWQKLMRYERAVCRRAGYIVAASGADAGHIANLGKSIAPTTVIPNGVDTDHFVPSEEVCAKPLAELGLVFAGKMDFRPNVDAMLWCSDEILPRIRAEIPLAHLTIVGQKPAPRIRALANRPGVAITGWVSDTRPFVADAAVYVVPLRMGSGTRLKVLEAMAMGKAIVSTSLGVQGIDLKPGQHALIADSPAEFAHAVVSLLRDPDRSRTLGASARALVLEHYDWRSIVPRFESVYGSLVGRPVD